MKNQQFYRLLKIKKKNSGFTLLELLTGLVMSGIVIGVLGVGFYQVLKITSEDASKSQAREQASRAIEFITDEIRRAKTIEPNADNANDNDGNGDNTFDTTDKTVVFALEIPEISSNRLVDINGDGTFKMLGSDDDATTTERIVYYLKSSTGTVWKGPQVLYRWGPPFNADGDYTENGWTEEALIDGIDDTVIASPCPSGTTQTPATAKGFYACLDGTGGVFNAAQIFLTGEVTAIGEDNTNFTSDTQVVARAKEANVAESVDKPTASLTFESLGAKFTCNSPDLDGDGVVDANEASNYSPGDVNGDGVVNLDDALEWGMRTDVGQSDSNPSDIRKWVYNPERKQQPIDIDTTKPLYLTAIPMDTSGLIDANSCQNTKFDSTIQNHEILGKDDWHDADGDGINDKNIVSTQIKIDFNNQYTFNGDATDGSYNSADVRTADTDGDGDIDSDDDINPKIKVLKQGTIVPDVGGYGDQQSLGEFLAAKGYAYLDDTDGKYKMYKEGDTIPLGKKLLGNDQRIIAFEIGQDIPSDTNSGFDLQDNIFVVTSEAFADKQFAP